MGKAPLELGWGLEGVVTAVAVHAEHDVVAAGYADGTTIVVQIDRPRPVLLKLSSCEERCARDFHETDGQACATPRMDVCDFDVKTRWCLGCGRIAGEVGEWSKLTPFRRGQLQQELASGLVKLGERALLKNQ